MIITIALFAIATLFLIVVFFGAPYVPSHRREVGGAFEQLYKVTSQDTLVDLGSGDGRVLRLARVHGARAVGYELNPLLWMWSCIRAVGDSRQSVQLRNYWKEPFQDATTLVYMFGVSRDAAKLERKMQREANRLGRTLYLITYGPALKDRQYSKKYRAHHLYEFTSLHPR